MGVIESLLSNWKLYVIGFFLIFFCLKEALELKEFLFSHFGIQTAKSLHEAEQEQKLTNMMDRIQDIENKNEEESKKNQTQFDTINESLKNITDKLDEMKIENLNTRIDDVRWEILQFGNAITKNDFDKEAYDHIIEKHAWYDDVIKKNNFTNGRMDATYEFIMKDYRSKFF